MEVEWMKLNIHSNKKKGKNTLDYLVRYLRRYCHYLSCHFCFSLQFSFFHSISTLNTRASFTMSFITGHYNTFIFNLVFNIRTIWHLMSRRYDSITYRLLLMCQVLSVMCQIRSRILHSKWLWSFCNQVSCKSYERRNVH